MSLSTGLTKTPFPLKHCLSQQQSITTSSLALRATNFPLRPVFTVSQRLCWVWFSLPFNSRNIFFCFWIFSLTHSLYPFSGILLNLYELVHLLKLVLPFTLSFIALYLDRKNGNVKLFQLFSICWDLFSIPIWSLF